MSVSVIIPAFNAANFVEDAIRSVLEQEPLPDEIIVVNDGSTDRDYDTLRTLDERIRVINQKNRGVAAARNVGFEAARSRFVAVLDADDVWVPGKLAAQMRRLSQSPDTDAVFCGGLCWRPDPGDGRWSRPHITAIGESPKVIRLFYRDFLYGIPVATSTMVVKKEVWQALGGFDELKRYGEDQDFNLRLSHRYKVDLLEVCGMLYRQHPSSATAHIQERNHWAELITGTISRLGVVDRDGVEAEPARVWRHLAGIHFIHGYEHFWRGRFDVARREFHQATRYRPLTPRYGAYRFVSSVPGLRNLIRRLWQSTRAEPLDAERHGAAMKNTKQS